MCPACLTTVALIAAGTGSAGGLAAVMVKKFADRTAAKARQESTRPTESDRKEVQR